MSDVDLVAELRALAFDPHAGFAWWSEGDADRVERAAAAIEQLRTERDAAIRRAEAAEAECDALQVFLDHAERLLKERGQP